jgi:hypothetical protein
MIIKVYMPTVDATSEFKTLYVSGARPVTTGAGPSRRRACRQIKPRPRR